jgi:L-fuconolactonase
MTSRSPTESVIEPQLPIVDAHHHLWFLPEAVPEAMGKQTAIAIRALAPVFHRHARYLLDEYLSDLNTGHNVRASVFVDAHAMYRAGGPDDLRSVGEVEFVNGVAAMAASGLFGDTKVCAGIVGNVDLRLGDRVVDVLNAHLQAGGGRYRGIRGNALYDDDPIILGSGVGRPNPFEDAPFRAGFKWLERLGLSFDALLLEPQLPQLVELAAAFPNTQIILNHVGAPLGIGRYAGKREERFPIWRDHIVQLSLCPNVMVKLGGLGTPFAGFELHQSTSPATSSQLARQWQPYIETCIEAFGVNRCMFGSNFPVDAAACSYPVLWNVFKRLTAGASQTEKIALFSGTAQRVYRLDI